MANYQLLVFRYDITQEYPEKVMKTDKKSKF